MLSDFIKRSLSLSNIVLEKRQYCHYMVKNPWERLRGYIGVYLNEEMSLLSVMVKCSCIKILLRIVV